MQYTYSASIIIVYLFDVVVVTSGVVWPSGPDDYSKYLRELSQIEKLIFSQNV